MRFTGFDLDLLTSGRVTPPACRACRSTDTVRHTFVLPSFDAYYGPFERGGASTGQALAALSEEIRRAIREEVRRDLADSGGPIKAETEYRIASGRR
jgi:hypothetical protein